MTTTRSHRWLRWMSLLGAIALIAGTAAIAGAEPPQPEPLGPDNPFYLRLPGLDVTKVGPAASIHGDPVAGRAVFAQICAHCHGERGAGGVPNLDSDDAIVPGLNPIDPGFVVNATGDPATFAATLDVFLQHGSIPAGDEPELFMLPFGDLKILTQQQIADIEAYIMQLNGLYWPDRWAPPLEIQKTANRAGDKVTYQITLVNHSFASLSNVTLRDTLPAGMTVVDSYRGVSGQKPGSLIGSTVVWTSDTDVPAGGSTGPYTIVAQFQGATVPPNVAQALFDWTTWNGTKYPTSAVSSPAVPLKPAPTRPAAPRATATTAPTTAPTPTPAPKPAGDADLGAQLYARKGCSACHMINGSGGPVGPELTHIATQPYDAMANTPEFLVRWLNDPKVQKPGTLMPHLNLSAAEIDALVAYLMTLK
jgi:uncharacterized repeat protein (TIGR01451 family)